VILTTNNKNVSTVTELMKILSLRLQALSMALNRVGINLSVRNIFNQEVYAYTTFGGLMAISREYTIRPRNVLASVYLRF
jgi:outer membrane receptor protein involved in Fe transport